MKLSVIVKEELNALERDCVAFIVEKLDDVGSIPIVEDYLTSIRPELLVGLEKSDDYYLITEDENNERFKNNLSELNIKDLIWIVEYLENTLP